MPLELPKRENKMLFNIDHFSPNVQCLCEDEDFVKAFLLAIPDKEMQQRFLLNTSNYNILHKDYNPHYVLFFRRTLPSNIPKHEERWTDVYPIVRMGLRREIPPGPHRIHTIILCDSLQHILSNWEKEWETNPFSDGEIVVNFPDYDQNTCICKFKPAYEQEALNRYLETENAIPQEEILRIIQSKKKEMDELLNDGDVFWSKRRG